MKALRVSAVVALLCMVAAYTGAYLWTPRIFLADQRAKTDLETLFPRSFGGWTVDDRMPVQLIAPDTQALLSKIYNQTLSRTYVNARGDRIMLSVAYGGDQSDATRAHRPEVCYPAQGFQILSSGPSSLTAAAQPLPVQRLVARLGGRNEPITYWIVVGDKVTLSGTQQKLAQLQYSVRGVIPDGMLVRVSSIDRDVDRAYAVHATFIDDIARAMAPERVAQVIGAADT